MCYKVFERLQLSTERSNIDCGRNCERSNVSNMFYKKKICFIFKLLPSRCDVVLFYCLFSCVCLFCFVNYYYYYVVVVA